MKADFDRADAFRQAGAGNVGKACNAWFVARQASQVREVGVGLV
jgi:hypothetical protein